MGNTFMPGNPREMITVAERRLPVRIRIGVPPGRLGQRYSEITAWLDQNCDADGWAITPSGMRGVLNDAISVYFAEATCQRLCPPVVCWVQSRDGGRRVSGADLASRRPAHSDAPYRCLAKRPHKMQLKY